MNHLNTNRKRPKVPIGDLYFQGSRPRTYRYLDSVLKVGVFLYTPDSGLERFGADFFKEEKGYDLVELNVSSAGLKLFIDLMNANRSDKIINTILSLNQPKKGG